MKTCIIGDCHFGKRMQTEGFLDYQISSFLLIVNYCIQNKIKTIIQLGDWFNNRTNIDFSLINRVRKEILDVLSKNDINLIYVSGNHDIYFRNNNELNSVEILFSDYENIHIISKEPQEIEICGKKTLCVPWILDSNSEQCFEKIKNSKADICIGHFDIQGFTMTKGITSKNGISPTIFKKFKNVYSGHFHLTGTDKNIKYVGSMCQLDWGDYQDKKRIIVINDEYEEYIVPDLFKKVDIKDDLDISEYSNSVLKIFINHKLSKKENNCLDMLIDNSMMYEVIDNTILLEDVKGIDTHQEDFSKIFSEYLQEQTEIDDNDKTAIKDIVTDLHSECSGLI